MTRRVSQRQNCFKVKSEPNYQKAQPEIPKQLRNLSRIMLFLHVRMMLLAFGKEQAQVYCDTCWYQCCSLLSPKQESHHEEKKLAPAFPPHLLSLSVVSWGGTELALEWLVLHQKSHLLGAGSILTFSKTLAMTADAQLCVSFLDMLPSEGSRQTLRISSRVSQDVRLMLISQRA